MATGYGSGTQRRVHHLTGTNQRQARNGITGSTSRACAVRFVQTTATALATTALVAAVWTMMPVLAAPVCL